MQLRSEQMRAFTDEVFESRLTFHLLHDFATEIDLPPEAEIRARVRSGIARARYYGLAWESSIAAFVFFLFAVGQKFDAHPRVRSVLTDAGIPPNRRLDGLICAMTPEDWESAALL